MICCDCCERRQGHSLDACACLGSQSPKTVCVVRCIAFANEVRKPSRSRSSFRIHRPLTVKLLQSQAVLSGRSNLKPEESG